MTIDAPQPGQTRQLRQLWKEAFGDTDAYLDSFFSLAFSPDRSRCITEDGRVTAALYWFDCGCMGEKFAYLYAVATAKDYRGQGLCRQLMDHTHGHLRNLGYAGTILVPASEELRQMYEKMGYLPGTRISRLTCPAGSSAASLRVLDRAEYERRRLELLPSGGVVQGGPMTALLADQMGLFGGDDFLLAAWMEDGVLHAEEFLGDSSVAPGIVKALGAGKGIFCLPGEDEDFSMYLPLTDRCPKPGYFGISLG